MDFIISTQYFTLHHLFIQVISLTHKYIWDLRGVLQIGVDLYNKLQGNPYVKSLPDLRWIIDTIFTLICTFFMGGFDIDYKIYGPAQW